MSYGLQALKLIIGLLTLTLLLRVLGKHSLSQLTPYDVVYLIVFGGILDSTFYDDEIGIGSFIFSVGIWSLSIYIIEFSVRKNSIFRVFFRGTPDHIVEDGKLNMKLFYKNNLEMEQLRIILRKNGIFSLREVKDIYLEPDGSFSINKYSHYQPITNSALNTDRSEDQLNVLLIDDGKIELSALKYIGKSKKWLLEEIKKLGIEDISNILYCEWSNKEGFYYKTKAEIITEKRHGYPN